MKLIIRTFMALNLMIAPAFAETPQPATSAPSDMDTKAEYKAALDQSIKDHNETQARYNGLMQEAQKTHEKNQLLMDETQKLIDRQNANQDRYEKILSTWEKQQAQYQKYMDSLPTAVSK